MPVDRAATLRGFGPLGLLAILVIFAGAALGPIISAPLVVVWTAVSRTPWRDIGYRWPKRWPVAVAGGILSGALLKLAMKAVVMPLLGADPVNRAYHYLTHNPAAVPGMIFTMIVSAGWGEETFFRGYLFERLGRLLGSSPVARAAIVLLTAVLFGLAHYSGQGKDGAMQGVMVGLVFGAAFAVSRSLVPLMIAHAAFDLTALTIIYFDVEAKIAHLVLR